MCSYVAPCVAIFPHSLYVCHCFSAVKLRRIKYHVSTRPRVLSVYLSVCLVSVCPSYCPSVTLIPYQKGIMVVLVEPCILGMVQPWLTMVKQYS